MTFAEAALEILRTEARPLTVAEITELALSRRLLSTRGKTPVATMSAALYALPAGGNVRRVYRPGQLRAARGSVRWLYVEKPPTAAVSTSAR